MADHVRKQFREAIANAVNGLPTTGAHVFQARAYRLQETELPGLRVYTEGDEVEPQTIHEPVLQQRTVTIVIAGVAKKLENLEDTFDAISKEVEQVLGSRITVGGVIVPLQYLGCGVDADDEGELPTGEIALRYQATLYNMATTPDVLV